MKHRTQNRHTLAPLRQAFTLVELLVCITIIIVLASIVFVATGKIRASAQQSNAVSALRQVGIAQVGYAAENGGAINLVRDPGEVPHEGGGKGWVGNSFWGRMQPYLFAGIETKDQKVLGTRIKTSLASLFATSDLKTMAGTPFSGSNIYADGSGISLPLGFNESLRPEPWGSPSKLTSAVGDPSRTFYCSYGRYFVNKTHGSVYTPLPAFGERKRAIYYLPNQKAIVCFLDGHLEMLSAPIPERMFESVN